MHTQVALQELVARHQDGMKRLRRKLKGSRSEVASLTDELTELRFKASDVTVLHSSTTTAPPAWQGPGQLGGTAPCSPVPGTAQAAVSPDLLRSMHALKERQTTYLQAVAAVQHGDGGSKSSG
jgi:hypothetical protein